LKKIIPPIHDDNIELVDLAKNKKLKSYPELYNFALIIVNQYKDYVAQSGNPWSITSCDIPQELKDALKLHYKTPPKGNLTFIKSFREELSPNFCPMCGSLGTGTLDHYLPKDSYAEFSIFSKNLIPACNCNTKRGTTLRGATHPVRVIHPFYDNFLDTRLYQAYFDGSFETPNISLVIIDPNHPHIEILDFHLQEVILKNNVIHYFNSTWSNLQRLSSNTLQKLLPAGQLSFMEFYDAIRKFLYLKDAELESPNNWSSMFYAGLLNDHNRLERLRLEINDIRLLQGN